MYDDHVFIQQVRDNPYDISRRLIYADWLEEQGEPQGELIRVQCEMASLHGGERWRRLAERERELLDRYAESWLRPLRELGAVGVSNSCFQGGLIEKVKIAARDFLDHGDELCRIAPALYALELKQVRDLIGEVAAADLPRQITRLDLSANRLEAAEMAQLKYAAWRSQLTMLDLKFNRIGDDGVRELCSTAWPGLETLDLSQNRVGADGGAALARWSDLGHIRWLNLGGNSLGDRGVAALADSPHVSQLEILELGSNRIGNGGAEALSKAGGFVSLRRLNLRANGIQSPALESLRRSSAMQRVEDLDTRANSPSGLA